MKAGKAGAVLAVSLTAAGCSASARADKARGLAGSIAGRVVVLRMAS